MKVAIIENNKFTIKNMPKPLLDEYDSGAIIKVKGCGLCGSDIVKLKYNLAPNGSVLGHEVAGEIIEINSKTLFKKGDSVVLGHHVPCFNCEYCSGGNHSMCRQFKSTNIIPGGFSEYIYVSEKHLNNTVFLNNLNVPPVEASFTEPLACCIRAVRRADIVNNSKNLVIGLGSIGILMGEALKAFGFDVFGCDLIEERVLLSEKYNFDKSFLLDNEYNVLKEMKKIAPIGFDTIFLTAGAYKSIDFAVKSAREGAKIIVFSSISNDNGFKNNDIYYRELTVMSSYSSSPDDLKLSVDFIENKRVNVKGLAKIYKLENINEALYDTISNKIMKAFIEI